MMNFIRFFLFFFLAFFKFQSSEAKGSPIDALEQKIANLKVDVESDLIPVSHEQIVISEDGLFVSDKDQTVLPVFGFFQQGNQMYALTRNSLENYMAYSPPAHCGHPDACWLCGGCQISDCFNRCTCKKKG